MSSETNRTLCRGMLGLVSAGIIALLMRAAAQFGIIAPLPTEVTRAMLWVFVVCTAIPHASWALAQISPSGRRAVPIFRTREDGWLLVLMLTILACALAMMPSRVGRTADSTEDMAFPIAIASFLFFASRFYVLRRANVGTPARVTT